MHNADTLKTLTDQIDHVLGEKQLGVFSKHTEVATQFQSPKSEDGEVKQIGNKRLFFFQP